MINATGNIWSRLGTGEHICITTNSCIRYSGSDQFAINRQLVMGAGAARDLKHYMPTAPTEAAKYISHLGLYYLVPIGACQTCPIHLFQVKKHYRQPAELYIIAEAVCRLAKLALKYPKDIFNLNYPGIGYGGLPISKVAPYVNALPNNVIVWQKG